MLYEKGEGGRLVCNLCAHRCKIAEGRFGICGVRRNVGGVLRTLVFGQVVAAHVDPIEKKPLFHFAPGSLSLSIATVGCNFRCSFCQNWSISHAPRDGGVRASEAIAPRRLVELAEENKCHSISYTYTEPTIFFEYAYETARLASEKGIKNVFVTNGYMTPEALDAIHPHLHAANVDLKAFDDKTYRRIMGAKLQPVLDSIAKMHSQGVWVEVTTLVIPTVNDSDEELGEIADFIASLSPSIPWHVSRFHPDYHMTHLPPTPVEALARAIRIGKERGLRYVYAGNVPGHAGENTVCHSCGITLIERFGFHVTRNDVRNGRCPNCGAAVDGVDL